MLDSAIVHSNVKQTVICASMFVVQSAAVWPKISMPKHKFFALVLTSFFFLAAINVEKHYSVHSSIQSSIHRPEAQFVAQCVAQFVVLLVPQLVV